MLEIVNPGFSTTIQDIGRHGYYHMGVPPSGAADKFSFYVGNLLLGNPVETAAIEMTLVGPKLEFGKKTVICLTGAPMPFFLNGEPIPMWEAVGVQEGDILTSKYCMEGVHSYLCVSGGITVAPSLGSRSTYELSGSDKLLLRKLRKGDVLPLSAPLPGVFKQIGRSIAREFIPRYETNIDVRVVLGVAADRISDTGVKQFLSEGWQISMESNRGAYRLTGTGVEFQDLPPAFGSGGNFSNVVDIAYPIGSILVPSSKELIAILKDGPIGGGFATIGTIISTDLDVIMQSRPNTIVYFHAVTVNQAMEIRLQWKKKMNEVLESLTKY